jgi:hypothetical protein
MSATAKTAMLAYLTGTFLVGGIAGGAIGYRYGRQPIFRPPNPQSMLQHLKERYTRELALTEEQQKLIEPIVRQNMGDWEQSHRDQMQQMQGLIKRGRERIETILTGEQKLKFRESEKNREHRFDRGPGGPGGPGGPKGPAAAKDSGGPPPDHGAPLPGPTPGR